MDRICTECRRPAPRLRRERCNACYMRLYRNGAIVGGARCAACGERRRQVLANVELGERCVLCGNCALVLANTRPRAATVADLAHRVARDRRCAPDRRAVKRSDGSGRRATDRRFQPPVVDPSWD